MGRGRGGENSSENFDKRTFWFSKVSESSTRYRECMNEL